MDIKKLTELISTEEIKITIRKDYSFSDEHGNHKRRPVEINIGNLYAESDYGLEDAVDEVIRKAILQVAVDRE